MKIRDIEQYLKDYPQVFKWMNECAACHERGYKPEMPEHIGGECSIMGHHIRKMFNPMEVDEMGFCKICAKLREK